MEATQRQLLKVRRALRRNASAESPRETRRGVFIPLPATSLGLLVLAAVVIGLGVFAYSLAPQDPGTNAAEAGFLRDMMNHHSQAVQMSTTIMERTQDPDLNAISKDIALTQSSQIGTMQGYLTLWDLPYAGDDKAMAWMGHSVDGSMPGMATPDQVAQLETLPIDQAEVLFLQLMIRHHQGGVEMAQAVLERSDQDDIRLIADRIVIAQNAEIGTMNDMLVKRGQAPITDPLPSGHEGM